MIIPTVSVERILKICFITFLAILFVGYAYYQARNLIEGPSIVLTNEPRTVQSERVVTLSGTARNVVVIRVNGKEMHTNEQGRFEHALVLENGYTVATIEAEDRYGRTIDLTRSFIYTPDA
jgi:hypothetical protein